MAVMIEMVFQCVCDRNGYFQTLGKIRKIKLQPCMGMGIGYTTASQSIFIFLSLSLSFSLSFGNLVSTVAFGTIEFLLHMYVVRVCIAVVLYCGMCSFLQFNLTSDYFITIIVASVHLLSSN